MDNHEYLISRESQLKKYKYIFFIIKTNSNKKGTRQHKKIIEL